MIVKRGSKFRVISKKGKNLGESESEEGAQKRLRQVEWFKHHPKCIVNPDLVKQKQFVPVIFSSSSKKSDEEGNKLDFPSSGKQMDLKDVKQPEFPSAPYPGQPLASTFGNPRPSDPVKDGVITSIQPSSRKYEAGSYRGEHGPDTQYKGSDYVSEDVKKKIRAARKSITIAGRKVVITKGEAGHNAHLDYYPIDKGDSGRPFGQDFKGNKKSEAERRKRKEEEEEERQKAMKNKPSSTSPKSITHDPDIAYLGRSVNIRLKKASKSIANLVLQYTQNQPLAAHFKPLIAYLIKDDKDKEENGSLKVTTFTGKHVGKGKYIGPFKRQAISDKALEYRKEQSKKDIDFATRDQMTRWIDPKYKKENTEKSEMSETTVAPPKKKTISPAGTIAQMIKEKMAANDKKKTEKSVIGAFRTPEGKAPQSDYSKELQKRAKERQYDKYGNEIKTKKETIEADTAKIKKSLAATSPVEAQGIPGDDLDREILRVSMIAELDAASFYEQMANKATDKKVKEILLDVAKEEKTHVGEFEALLTKLDPEQKRELLEGAKEVASKVGKSHTTDDDENDEEMKEGIKEERKWIKDDPEIEEEVKNKIAAKRAKKKIVENPKHYSNLKEEGRRKKENKKDESAKRKLLGKSNRYERYMEEKGKVPYGGRRGKTAKEKADIKHILRDINRTYDDETVTAAEESGRIPMTQKSVIKERKLQGAVGNAEKMARIREETNASPREMKATLGQLRAYTRKLAAERKKNAAIRKAQARGYTMDEYMKNTGKSPKTQTTDEENELMQMKKGGFKEKWIKEQESKGKDPLKTPDEEKPAKDYATREEQRDLKYKNKPEYRDKSDHESWGDYFKRM